MTRRRLAILVSFSGDGGVEVVVARLAAAFARQPQLAVDVLLLRARGRHLARLPQAARILRLRAGSARLATGEVARYLRRERPDVLLAAKDRAGRLALRARRRAGVAVPVYLQLHNQPSRTLARRPALVRAAWRWAMRRSYPQADGIIAVSRDVAEDVRRVSGVPAERVAVLPNPVFDDELLAQAQAAVDHPWLRDPRAGPVVLGVGRLIRQKGFDRLLAALARMARPARLILLGEGPERAALQAQAERLGLAGRVDLVGFRPNPWAWMRRADLFVLPSRWEGLGMVLVEALALGTPVVACAGPGGPAEILQDGRLAPLAPCDDPAALAAAMDAVLAHPPPAADLRAAVARYRVEASAAAYLRHLGLAADGAQKNGA